MTKGATLKKCLAAGLILCLQALLVPTFGSEADAALSGSIFSTDDRRPLVGARLHVGDPETGKIFSSSVTDSEGRFGVEGIPAGAYEIAVESGDHLFVVGKTVQLAPGQVQAVNVAVRNDQTAPDPGTAQKMAGGGRSFWNNPFTAALVVVGSAVVLGVAVDELTDDEDAPELTASPARLR